MPAVSSLSSWHSLRRLVFYRLPSELAEGGPREVQTCNKRGLVDDHLVGSGARAARGLVLKQPSQIFELGAAFCPPPAPSPQNGPRPGTHLLDRPGKHRCRLLPPSPPYSQLRRFVLVVVLR